MSTLHLTAAAASLLKNEVDDIIRFHHCLQPRPKGACTQIGLRGLAQGEGRGERQCTVE